MLKAYRWQYIVSGVMEPRFRKTLFALVDESQRRRIEKALPPAGTIGVFDRSHYEDVLMVRVHDLVPPAEWETRYDRINAWEAGLVEQGFVPRRRPRSP